jgi:hypothetical protein
MAPFYRLLWLLLSVEVFRALLVVLILMLLLRTLLRRLLLS